MEVISYLSLGSNIENRVTHINKAIKLLEENCGTILSESKWYETTPLGFDADTNFINLCIALKTSLSPFQLLNEIDEIEKAMGRIRNGNGYTSRPIDIDIIFYDHRVFSTKYLTVPHPLFKERNFVLIPLNDIAKSFVDPQSLKSVEVLLHLCADDSEVKLFKKQ